MKKYDYKVMPIDIKIEDSAHSFRVRKENGNDLLVELDVHTPGIISGATAILPGDDERTERLKAYCGYIIGCVIDSKATKIENKNEKIEVVVPSTAPSGTSILSAPFSAFNSDTLIDFQGSICSGVPSVSDLYILMSIYNNASVEEQRSEKMQREILRTLIKVEHPKFFDEQGLLTTEGRAKLTKARERIGRAFKPPIKSKKLGNNTTGRKGQMQG